MTDFYLNLFYIVKIFLYKMNSLREIFFKLLYTAFSKAKESPIKLSWQNSFFLFPAEKLFLYCTSSSARVDFSSCPSSWKNDWWSCLPDWEGKKWRSLIQRYQKIIVHAIKSHTRGKKENEHILDFWEWRWRPLDFESVTGVIYGRTVTP